MSTEETLENQDDTLDSESTEGLEPGALSDEAALGEADDGAGKKTLGLDRWIQLGFMVTALMLVWFYDHLINAVWYLFADPSESLVSAGAVLAGIATTVVLYRQKAVYGIVHDISDELTKVAWPTSKETSNSTVVVVITSIVAALVLFLFDTVWSAVTDLVYKV